MMFEKLILLHHETVILNNPGRETISAGLGPIEQYGIILIFVVVVGIVLYLIKRKGGKK